VQHSWSEETEKDNEPSSKGSSTRQKERRAIEYVEKSGPTFKSREAAHINEHIRYGSFEPSKWSGVRREFR